MGHPGAARWDVPVPMEREWDIPSINCRGDIPELLMGHRTSTWQVDGTSQYTVEKDGTSQHPGKGAWDIPLVHGRLMGRPRTTRWDVPVPNGR